ncbi:hypothetical protein D9M72_537990 [compost metagenome]
MVHLGLAHAPDVRLRAARAVGLKQLGQAALGQGAVLQVVAKDFRQQVGCIDQGFFGGLAHAGADLVHHRAEHEITGKPDEQEIDQEDADAERHQLRSGT